MAEQAPDRQSIVYVVGLNNSGSTWLSLLLAQMENTTNIGEVWYSLETSDEEARNKHSCTCGAMMAECEFWGQVLRERDSLPGYDLQHARVLELFREKFPGRVLIDSSKFVSTLSKGWLSDKLRDQVDIKFIHIVRDYRGWANKRHEAYTRRGRRRSLYMHCVRWFFRNKARERFLEKSGLPTLTIPYEALVFNLQDQLRRISDFTGLTLPEDWQSVDLERLSLHMSRGNGVRFDVARYAEVRYRNQWTLDSRFLWLGPLLIPFHRYWKRLNTNQ